MRKLNPGDYANYTWTRIKYGTPIRVQILEERDENYLVRLLEDLMVPGDKTVHAGRLHYCGKQWLTPLNEEENNG